MLKVGLDMYGIITDFDSYVKEKGSKYFGSIINEDGFDIKGTWGVSRR